MILILNLFVLGNLFNWVLCKFFAFTPAGLCCGIFGMSAVKGKKVNTEKLKILGLYNNTRGVHSCGYYYNGAIEKGVDANKNFMDFIVNRPLVRGTLPTELFLGHTRQATNGIHNLENAHPHQVDNYVQTHNGTIINTLSLCRKYDIESAGLGIDSHMLATIIRHRGFDVLNYYDGFAALAFTFMDDPETLYLYHGACRKIRDGATEEERPLYYVILPDGLYYSSMENSLKYIAAGKAEPVLLPHNTVFKIQNGAIVEEVYKVNRLDANLWVAPAPKTANDLFSEQYIKQLKQKHFGKQNAKVVPMDNTDRPIIWRESAPCEQDYKDESVYYRWGRFHRGINKLLNGEYEIERGGKIFKKGDTTTRTTDVYYFIRGAMMTDKKAYTKMLTDHPQILTDDQSNICFYLSKYSKYPVTTLPGEAETQVAFVKTWFAKGKKAKGSFRPKFSMRTYNINEEGLLSSISPAFTGETVLVNDSVKMMESTLEGQPDKPLVIQGFMVNENGDLFTKPTTDEYPKGMLFDANNNPILNVQAEVDMLGQSAAAEDDGADVNTQQLLDRIAFNTIIGMVRQWCDAKLYRTKVKDLPEQFLMFIDYIITIMFERERDIKEISEGLLEQYTTDYLDDLMVSNLTVRESLELEKDYDKLLTFKHMYECFKPYDIDELAKMENRYNFIDFQPTPYPIDVETVENVIKNTPKLINPVKKVDIVDAEIIEDETLEPDFVQGVINRTNTDNETRERCNLLVTQLQGLVDTADRFQELDASDSAQTVAFTLYQQVGALKRRIEEIALESKYLDIVEKLVKIKC